MALKKNAFASSGPTYDINRTKRRGFFLFLEHRIIVNYIPVHVRFDFSRKETGAIE